MRPHQRVPRTFINVAYSVFAMVLATSCLAERLRADEPNQERLVCCGAAEVFVFDVADPQAKLWSWTASDSPSIPESFHSKFLSTDDCKPYADELMLITSSSRGVALIRRETKRCIFLADVANAHSACLLPDQQLAVAASTSGDEIQFFNYDDANEQDTLAAAVPTQRIELLGAHGTVWDATRKRLWALGTEELLQIQYNRADKTTAAWSVAARYQLPSMGGHDLSPAHDDENLWVTTDTQVLRFNMDDQSFEVAEGFGDQKKVKSVDVHPLTKRIVYQQALPTEWWSHTVRFADAPAITLGKQRLYKVRWDAATPRP